jgi:hypothetical protein
MYSQCWVSLLILFLKLLILVFLLGATEIGERLINSSKTVQTNMPLHGLNVTLLLLLLSITTKYLCQVLIFGFLNQLDWIYGNLPQTSNSLLVWYQICAQVTLSTLIHTPDDTRTWTTLIHGSQIALTSLLYFTFHQHSMPIPDPIIFPSFTLPYHFVVRGMGRSV